MSDLRELFGDLGFTNTKSLLQSGNLVFNNDRRTGATVERLLEKETAKRLGVSVDYIVRSADEWEHVIARNPFPKEAKNDPGRLVVFFLKTTSQAENLEALRTGIKGPESIHLDAKQLYVIYPDGIGRSKLTGTLIEKKLRRVHAGMLPRVSSPRRFPTAQS